MAYPWQKGYMSPNKEADSRKQHCLSQLGLRGNEEQTPRLKEEKKKGKMLKIPPPLTYTYTHSHLKKIIHLTKIHTDTLGGLGRLLNNFCESMKTLRFEPQYTCKHCGYGRVWLESQHW